MVLTNSSLNGLSKKVRGERGGEEGNVTFQSISRERYLRGGCFLPLRREY